MGNVEGEGSQNTAVATRIYKAIK